MVLSTSDLSLVARGVAFGPSMVRARRTFRRREASARLIDDPDSYCRAGSQACRRPRLERWTLSTR